MDQAADRYEVNRRAEFPAGNHLPSGLPVLFHPGCGADSIDRLPHSESEEIRGKAGTSDSSAATENDSGASAARLHGARQTPCLASPRKWPAREELRIEI